MLEYFLENDYIDFYDEPVDAWEEAIRISCRNLLDKGIITATYVDEIIDCVNKYGPYIVLIPGVAMPHASGESEGVNGTAISFTKFKYPVAFEKGNEDKQAQLFFTLAAKNPDEHVENIGKLAEMLMLDGAINDLNTVESIKDYQNMLSTT